MTMCCRSTVKRSSKCRKFYGPGFPECPSRKSSRSARSCEILSSSGSVPFYWLAETMRRRVSGFAMLLHEPEIRFCYLDWIAMAGGKTGGGLGSALYDRVRREAAALEAQGLFL